jgi:WD40 repeat protein
LKLEGHNGWVESVAISPDSRRVLSASRDGTIRLWEIATGKELHQFEAHAGGALCVAFTLDGTMAVSGGADGMVRVWRLPK